MRMPKLVWMTLILSACASPHPVTPDASTVKVSREKPSSKCQEIGKVEGTSLSAKAKPSEVLENMKAEATSRGANYVQVLEYSETGTAVNGMAYNCP
jgi:hypothetical protein